MSAWLIGEEHKIVRLYRVAICQEHVICQPSRDLVRYFIKRPSQRFHFISLIHPHITSFSLELSIFHFVDAFPSLNESIVVLESESRDYRII